MQIATRVVLAATILLMISSFAAETASAQIVLCALSLAAMVITIGLALEVKPVAARLRARQN
ncbi:MAG: hypothetical protein KKB37_00865 [Alphaproteobacteria bacterium]|nr:hypothetical protein [Alphaproteobacteria bacterium]